jgi:competence protein ComEA
VARVTSASGLRRHRWSVGAIIVVVVGAFAVTVAIGIVRGAASGAETVLPDGGVTAPPAVAEPSNGPVEAVVYVHVAGAVNAPGLYALPAGARVVDAVASAGGFTGDADRSVVNLARPVTDGEQIVVPRVGEAAPAIPDVPGGTGDAGVIDLNSADGAALEELPGIGPALAERILAWREEHGRFASVEDLLAVPGIGEKLLEGVRDRVRV